MESSSKNYTLCTLFLLLSYFTHATPLFDEEAIKTRIQNMKSEIVDPRYDVVVRSYLRTYLLNSHTLAENIIGRSVLYFPIFDKHLKEHGLPTDLKYLAIVESALNPKAISRCGAVGLWQFMPPTARELGLKMDANLDERCDPERATEAAMKHLKYLYKRFEDWPLVLAAYNSGSGTISRAVKRARSHNYWTVRRYLPRETHNYVPAFIAASYLVKHYTEHEIIPNLPAPDMQNTETIKVYVDLKFEEITTLTELPVEVITGLNPSYRKAFIPANERGNNLTLPTRVMPMVRTLIESKRPDADSTALKSTQLLLADAGETSTLNYIKTTYTLLPGETLELVAQKLKCTVAELKVWNQLKTTGFVAGQTLTVFQLQADVPALALEKMEAPTKLTPLKIGTLDATSNSLHNLKATEAYQHDRFAYYTVKKKERLSDIARKTPGVITEELKRLNQRSNDALLQPGTIIKIKRL